MDFQSIALPTELRHHGLITGAKVRQKKQTNKFFATFDDKKHTKMIKTTENIASVHEKLIVGLKDFLDKNGFTKACLGMSGGIDSAVVLALISEVLPPEDIVAVMMPSQFSSGHSVTDSEKMIAHLKVQSAIIPIESAYNAMIETLQPLIGGTPFDTTEENIQARLRGVILMALSNKRGHIVLNTSNKSEAAVGYGTLYGDMVGAIGVIADLYKTEVYALARYINRNGEMIPQAIIDKAPSAELHPGQRDQDSLPPYDVLDAILRQLVEGGLAPNEVKDADPELVQRVAGMLARANYKRMQAPPALRVSTMPFEEFRLRG